jgi:anti-anti-sigma factor
MWRFVRQRLKVTIVPDGGVLVRVSGELDASTASLLEEAFAAVERLPDRGPILVDLSTLSFIDAHGVRALLALHQQARRAGRSLSVIEPEGPGGRALELLRESGLAKSALEDSPL